MKRTCIILILVLIGCTSARRTEEVTVEPDSANQIAGEKQPVVSTPVFPEWQVDKWSEDPRENKVSAALQRIMKDYEHNHFSSIKGHYEREWKRYTEHDVEYRCTEQETLILYLDSSYTVRSVVRAYELKSQDGTKSKQEIYNLKNDSLVSLYENVELTGPITIQKQTRVVAAQCPACGVYLSKQKNSDPYVTPVVLADLITMRKALAATIDNTKTALDENWKRALTDGDHQTVEITYTKSPGEETPGEKYTVKYTISTGLFDNYILR